MSNSQFDRLQLATSIASVDTLCLRDALGNCNFNNINTQPSQSIISSGTPITITPSHPQLIYITGTNTQRIDLLNATTITVGYKLCIYNETTSVVSIYDYIGVLIYASNKQEIINIECTNNLSAAGLWKYFSTNSYHFPTILPRSVPTTTTATVYEWTQFTGGTTQKPIILAHDGSQFITPVLGTYNLNDVSNSAPTLNQAFVWDGLTWTPSYIQFSIMSDVAISSLADKNLL